MQWIALTDNNQENLSRQLFNHLQCTLCMSIVQTVKSKSTNCIENRSNTWLRCGNMVDLATDVNTKNTKVSGIVLMFSLSYNPGFVFGQQLNSSTPRKCDGRFKDAQKYLCIKKTFPEIFGFHLPGCISCSFFLAPLHKTTYFVQIESALAELLSVLIQTQSGYLILC